MAFAIVDVRQLHSEKRAQQVLKQPVVGFSGEHQAMGFRGFGTGAELVPRHPVSVRPDVPLARRVDDAAALRDLTLRAALALASAPHGFTVGDFAARGKTRWYPATIKAVVTSDNAAALA